jgi:two-component system chemotaxis response regulator CheB
MRSDMSDPRERERGPGIEAVVIGGSAGAVTALGSVLSELPASFPPVLVVLHIPSTSPSLLVDVFAPHCRMRVCEPEAFERIEWGSVYFAPPDYHLLVERDRRCSLSIEPAVRFSRPSVDVLFGSAAAAYRSGLAAVVLTGASDDGAEGLRAVHAAGGIAIVQEPASAEAPTMPKAALAAVPSARVVRLSEIARHLLSLAQAS